MLVNQRRLRDTFDDIKEYQPELVLTIDSKGFTFRVLKALRASEQKTGSKRIRKAHYVAPSVWAYKHRGKRDFTELSQLLDAMFTILPFEEDIFSAGEKGSSLESWSESESKASWCHFVGHPAVEDFLEVCGVYKGTPNNITMRSKDNSIETGPDALLKLSKFDMRTLMARGQLFQALVASGREAGIRARVRKDFEIPSDALIICALVGRWVCIFKTHVQI
ncbi:unnamed protein product [Phytophthora lilii]|uniref:lipid-A-disaccharide synthase n=1 Tax=Phytophthora lilii TaxID=2077276 RepID=A0A9W6TR86_9STRA|nr:unnamed protein product [Phytophthora lilii]